MNSFQLFFLFPFLFPGPDADVPDHVNPVLQHITDSLQKFIDLNRSRENSASTDDSEIGSFQFTSLFQSQFGFFHYLFIYLFKKRYEPRQRCVNVLQRTSKCSNDCMFFILFCFESNLKIFIFSKKKKKN